MISRGASPSLPSFLPFFRCHKRRISPTKLAAKTSSVSTRDFGAKSATNARLYLNSAAVEALAASDGNRVYVSSVVRQSNDDPKYVG